MRLPNTIKYPKTFLASPAAGFDGVFDWSWTKGCFGNKNITPMDFDGVVERKNNFLVFETKDNGIEVTGGQLITLESIYKLRCFTIVFIQGKLKPEKVKVWRQPGFGTGAKMEAFVEIEKIQHLKDFVTSWYEFADTTPFQFPDLESRDFLTQAIEKLGGQVEWKSKEESEFLFWTACLKKSKS